MIAPKCGGHFHLPPESAVASAAGEARWGRRASASFRVCSSTDVSLGSSWGWRVVAGWGIGCALAAVPVVLPAVPLTSPPNGGGGGGGEYPTVSISSF